VEFGNFSSPYIAGVWKGNYGNGKGRTTLTINNDGIGVNEFVGEGIKRSHSVRAKYSNGEYSVSGVEWIDKPQGGWLSMDTWTGTIINGKFSGRDFNLEKSDIIVLLPISKTTPQRFKYAFTMPAGVGNNDWQREGEYVDMKWKEGNAPFGNGIDGVNTRWTSSQIFIRNKFNISDVSSIEHAYINVWYDDDVEIYINGKKAFSQSGNISNYIAVEFDKSLLKNGINLIAAKCTQSTGGQFIDVGVFVTSKKSAKYTPVAIKESTNEVDNSRRESVSDTSNKSVQVESSNGSSSGSCRFPQTSERLLSSSDLSGLSKYDLKIMWNEIFARHGWRSACRLRNGRGSTGLRGRSKRRKGMSDGRALSCRPASLRR
jgi:hypothetical protein